MQINNYINTIKYLKYSQIYHQIFHRIRSFLRKILCIKYKISIPQSAYPIRFQLFPETQSTKINNKFTFLNQSIEFKNIEWDYSDYGKLWTYNLNYMDYLLQSNIDFKEGEELMLDYISDYSQLKVGKDPYTISLRCVNWIKLISKYEKEFKSNENYHHINASLYAQYKILSKNLEYHLMGNHLLENGVSLLFGAYYFRDEKLYSKAKKIIQTELKEQILDDGAHFELSPMYHQIILTRVLDCIQLVNKNVWQKNDLKLFMDAKASCMLAWLNVMTYENGSIPQVNDSTYNITSSSSSLFKYAKSLNLQWNKAKLSESGYRRWNEGYAEILMDIGQIGPDYIPGHAHADTFNFEFLYKGRPIIVDTGISTYEKNSRRQLERSTESHNTIRVDGKDSSEVWGGFRVARRAKIISFKEGEDKIKATHDGYKKMGVLHTRSFNKSKGKFVIEDRIESKKIHQIESFLHFHPDCNINVEEDKIKVDSEITIEFKNHRNLIVEEYDYSLGFNKTKKAKKIRAFVEKKSTIEIQYEN